MRKILFTGLLTFALLGANSMMGQVQAQRNCCSNSAEGTIGRATVWISVTQCSFREQKREDMTEYAINCLLAKAAVNAAVLEMSLVLKAD